jgi:hypothetical protein
VQLRVIRGGALWAALLAAAAGQAAAGPGQGFAGWWFQCQPRWQEQDNFLLVEVKPGERAFTAKWGVDRSATGKAEKDASGGLMLRGCHAKGMTRSSGCDPARPPLFATLPKKLLDAAGPPPEEALRRGAWLRMERAELPRLAAQCAALRPKSKG